jgi:hypothetical protein
MTPRDSIFGNLASSGRTWHWLQWLSLLGSGFCFALLLTESFVQLQWLSSWKNVVAIGSLVTLGASIALWPWRPTQAGEVARKAKVAAALERSHPNLEDRLNTLCHLELAGPTPQGASFLSRIEAQARALLSKPVTASLGEQCSAALSFALLTLLVGTTVYFNHRFAPWQLLRSAASTAQVTVPQPRPPPAPAPAVSMVLTPRTWGEVRITKPGADLVASRDQTILLQVEAAADQPLLSLSWSLFINAGSPSAHPLPVTNQQLFAVAQTNLLLAQIPVSDWDVLSYFAAAATRERVYTSELYFIDIHPPRNLTQNSTGHGPEQEPSAPNLLYQILARQQQVIRQSHHLARSSEQKGPDHSMVAPIAGEANRVGTGMLRSDPPARERPRNLLSGTETELAKAVRHLQAAIEAGSGRENEPTVDKPLSKAADALTSAAVALQTNTLPFALEKEQLALVHLLAARKALRPSESQAGSEVAAAQQPTQTGPAINSLEQLEQITEFRNESAAARDFLKQAIEQQSALAEEAAKPRAPEHANLAGRERQMHDSLKDFVQQHARPFAKSRRETEQALSSLAAAADSLSEELITRRPSGAPENNNRERGDPATPPGVTAANALQELERLSSSLAAQNQNEQLADAYRLKNLLDGLLRDFDRFTTNDTDTTSNRGFSSIARQAHETIAELQKLARKEEGFGRQLGEALSDSKVAPLQEDLLELEQNRGGEKQRRLAAKAREGLGAISKAFDQSRPSELQRPLDSSSPATENKATELAHQSILPEGFTLEPMRLPPSYRERIQSYFKELSEK